MAQVVVEGLGTGWNKTRKRSTDVAWPGRQAARWGYRKLAFTGRKFRCPCCAKGARRFRPYNGRANAACPWCGSLERHRCLWLYLEREMAIDVAVLRVLHVAPDAGVAPLLQGRPNLTYVSFDIAPGCDVRGDLGGTPFKSDAFDLIVCSHVLQDIPDDRAAMLEIARLLAPSGRAVLLVPVDKKLSATDEDPSVIDPIERRRRFGQAVSVRIYGLDFLSRLAEAGFETELIDYATVCSAAERQRFRLVGSGIDREQLFICRAPTAR